MKRLLTITLLALLAGCSVSSPATDTAPTETPFYAWDFTMSSLDGETYTLMEMRGGWVVVNFWATWCGPCREEMPILQTVHNVFDEVTVLGINQRESVDEVRTFVDAFGISFPILLNPGDQTLIDYNVMGLPQTVVIDPNGIIVHRQFGPVELDTFSALITDLIGEDNSA